MRLVINQDKSQYSRFTQSSWVGVESQWLHKKVKIQSISLKEVNFMSTTPTCPLCNYELKYDRNQMLKDGPARYYHCLNCGSKIRIILGKIKIIKTKKRTSK